MKNGDLWQENQHLRELLHLEKEKRLQVEAELLWVRKCVKSNIQLDTNAISVGQSLIKLDQLESLIKNG